MSVTDPSHTNLGESPGSGLQEAPRPLSPWTRDFARSNLSWANTVTAPGDTDGVKLRRLREEEPLDPEVTVVRGGELDTVVLRADAARYHEIYGTYGISVFALRDIILAELAQQTPLVRFGRLASTTSTPTLARWWAASTRSSPTHTMNGED